MPRTADHDARRRQVLEAVCRITIGGGLSAATFREVAAEAGVSVRLVQYYFGTKADLLAAANRFALERSAQRIFAAVDGAGPDASPRDIVRAVMHSFLPTDTKAREAMILFYAFYTAQLTDPTPATDPTDSGAGLQRLLAHHITRGQRNGHVPGDVDPNREATLLFLLLPSLASGAVAGRLSLDDAKQTVDYAVTRVFRAPTPERAPARASKRAAR